MKSKTLLNRMCLLVVLSSLLIILGSVTGLTTETEGGIFQMTGDITVPAEKVINGDVDSMAGNITIYGKVNGNVTAMAGNITIEGQVNGNVQCMAGNIYLRKEAEVIGDVTAMAGRIYQDEGTVISGKATEVVGSRNSNVDWNIGGVHFDGGKFRITSIPWYFKLWGGITGLISWLALAALMMLFFANHVQRLSVVVQERPGYYFIIGFVGLILSPLALILLAVTIIGIPLIPVVILLIIFGAIFGQLAVARIIGEKIKVMFNLNYRTEMVRVIVGVLAMFLLTLIPVIGWVFFFITLCIGFGVALKNRFGIEKRSDEHEA